MDLKNQLTKTPYLVLFIILISVGVGTVSALATYTFTGNVIITDDLLVEGQADVSGGPIISTRSTLDGNTGNLVIQRTEGATAETPSFALSHRTSDKDLWLYGFDGSTFKNFVGFDYPNYKINFPATSNTLVVDAANDKVGIGTSAPSSELDVAGNVTVSGDVNVAGTITGTNFLRTYFLNSGLVTEDGSSAELLTIFCDDGDAATGGGGDCGSCGDANLRSSLPLAGIPQGWATWWSNPDMSTSASLRAHVICLDFDPPHIP